MLIYLRNVFSPSLMGIDREYTKYKQGTMPLMTVNMATPINSTTSQIFVLPDPDTVYHHIRADANRKYKILKCIELILALFTLIFFTFGDTVSESTVKDMTINACLGAITIYPMICMAFSLSFYKAPRKMLVCNILNSLVLFVLSTLILSSWWKIEYLLDEMINKNSTVYLQGQFSATLRFVGAIVGVVNGIIYTSESLVMALEMKGYV